MSSESVTLNLPKSVYDSFRRVATKYHRPIDEVLVEAMTAVAPTIDTETFLQQTALAQMAYLNDAALWQAANATMNDIQQERLAELHDKQQRDGLSPNEQEEEEKLQTLYRETLLVRAQAAVLLKQRNYDISNPEQFSTFDQHN